MSDDILTRLEAIKKAVAAQAVINDVRAHLGCDLCRRVDGHEPTCLAGLADQIDQIERSADR